MSLKIAKPAFQLLLIVEFIASEFATMSGQICFRIVNSLFLFGLVLVSGGCSKTGKEPVRAVVAGELKYLGQPIKEGMIRFIPESGPSAQGIISEGKYKISHKGGVPVGACKVEIEAFDDTGKTQKVMSAIPEVKEKSMRESKQILPDKFNTKSRLKFDVEPGRDNDFSMDLK